MTHVRCLLTGIVIAACLTPFAIMLFDRRPPVELGQGTIMPAQVHAFDKVTVSWPMIERKICEGRYTRRIKDSTGYIHAFDELPVAYGDTASSDRKWFSREMTVPNIAPGPAVYWTTGHRWCNFMQKYIWPIPFRGPNIPFEGIAGGRVVER